MKTKRTNKVLTISVLCVAVLALAVGFAAFSNTLTVSTNASVTPDANTFKVVFSSDSSSLKTDAVAPVPSDLGESGTIDNTTNPTISNLQANFTEPGESVTYTFYVRNEGEFLAYLNSINLRGKNCVPGDGTDFIMVNSACTSIITTVSIGNITTSETKTDITGETLNPGDSKEVTVTISYDENGSRADGPFRVIFGDITMFYSTVTGQNEEVAKLCKLSSSDGQIDIGDSVACSLNGNIEKFYVVPNDTTAHPTATDDNVTLFAMYNLDVGADAPAQRPGRQNFGAFGGTLFTGINYNNCNFTQEIRDDFLGETATAAKYLEFYNDGYGCGGSIPFSETPYWKNSAAGTFVYNEKSLLYPYVENYKTYLINKGLDVKEASLMSYTQYQRFTKPSNFHATSFWLGSMINTRDLYSVEIVTSTTGTVETAPAYIGIHLGVRPVIVIAKADIDV